MDPAFLRECEEVLFFRRQHGGQKPVRSRVDPEQNRLAMKLSKLKIRCEKALGPHPSQRQLTPDEVKYYYWCLSSDAVEAPQALAASPAPSVTDLCPTAASSSNSGKPASTFPAAPGLCPHAAGGGDASAFVAHPFSRKFQCSGCEFQLTCLTEEAAGIAAAMQCPRCRAPVIHRADVAAPSPTRKRLRQKSPAPAAPGLCPSAAGSSSSAAPAAIAIPAAPGLCPHAAGSGSGHPSTVAQQMSLRGLNIQYPFSRLILLGAKSIEARTFPLGHLNIANADEELFLIETPGAKNARGAVVDDIPIGPPPQRAQVIGTVSFSASQAYASESAWKRDRPKHCIREGGRYDWGGTGEMHAWYVDKVQRFSEPVAAGTKSQTGYGTPRTLEVTLQSVGDAS